MAREAGGVSKTRIDYVDETWNSVWGCTGSCPYCYARGIARRFGKRVCGRNDFVPTWVEKNFRKPFPRKPSRIFVNSMSDLADWNAIWQAKVAHRIFLNPQHRFLFLSKRPWDVEWAPLPNAMLGYSVTCQKNWNDLLLRGPGHVTFLSIEPILEPITLSARWLPKWIIVGSETGNRKGRIIPKVAWIDDIYWFARENKIPIFFKKSLRHYWPQRGYFPQEYPA
jgi:protein gp37